MMLLSGWMYARYGGLVFLTMAVTGGAGWLSGCSTRSGNRGPGRPNNPRHPRLRQRLRKIHDQVIHMLYTDAQPDRPSVTPMRLRISIGTPEWVVDAGWLARDRFRRG